MLKLTVVQAEYGDCLLLESSDGNNSNFILIDGGPSQTYKRHLNATLKVIVTNKKLGLVILSHIDNDHVLGLLDLFEDIKKDTEAKVEELTQIGGLWHNSFSDIVGENVNKSPLMQNLFSSSSFSTIDIESNISRLPAIGALKGVGEGRDLRKLAHSLHIPINPQFGGSLIDAADKYKNAKVGSMKFNILGPTQKNLDKLRKVWNDWLRRRHKATTKTSDFRALQVLDASIANLSSIMFMVESQGKKLLFTGDGLGEAVVDALSKRGLLDSQGRYHVDLMKVPHHGSERNSSREFFDLVTADAYVISANGRDDNPSLATLEWIIESKRKKNKIITIFLTNRTNNTDKILQKYDQNKFHYRFHFLKKGSHSLVIRLN